MGHSQPKIVECTDREATVPCESCRRELLHGDQAAICQKCGALHHLNCWEQTGCSSYWCVKERSTQPTSATAITITQADLDNAVPLPTTPRRTYEPLPDPPKRWNWTAVWSAVLAMFGLGILVFLIGLSFLGIEWGVGLTLAGAFGAVVGLIAMVVACIGLVSHTARHKGVALGVLAIAVGLADMIGFAVTMAALQGNFHGAVALDDLTPPDVDAIDQLEEPLRRTMRANVLIQSGSGLRSSLGSGVILRFRDGLAWIITNRHVIDSSYSDRMQTVPELSTIDDLTVQAIGSAQVPARVEWIAPHGVDLALVSCRLDQAAGAVAHWDIARPPKIGESVFAVGNPHGFGWTHSSGEISQLRRRSAELFQYTILQTTTPLNPGNSGGGLYSQEGLLLGINSLTGDKRIAEGLGFSIALKTFFDLLPDDFDIQARNLGETP